MLFNSFEFVEFLAVVLVLYYVTSWRMAQIAVLILSSLVFYGAKEPWLVLLLLFSIGSNALISRRQSLRMVGVALNLGLLAVFKYGPLFLPARLAGLPLPIGISFFTFEGIMILMHRPTDRSTLAQHFARVGLLMSFFPHLVAGPIVKARDFFPQIGPKQIKDIDWSLAFRSLTVGYFLKLVIADNLKEQTNMMVPAFFCDWSTAKLSMMLVGYSMQIFADFAGYSLIAIGLAALFGYRLPDNFNFPYLATSFSEFWKRWHISLSTFLREYLYVPLGGNRYGIVRTYLNIMIVMGLGGLWHGAAWSYAAWGLMHGLALVSERLSPRMPRLAWLKMPFVFSYVSLAWLLFKLPHFEDVQLYLHAMANNLHRDSDLRCMITLSTFSLPVILYHLSQLWCPGWLRQRPYLVYGSLIFFILTNSGPPGNFIYFQF